MSQPSEVENSLAIIPARGGSKRIPRKNIRIFRGKPILAWSVEAALRSNLFAEVMVSTEDAEIAETALALGAKVPFFRSAKASDDYATTADVLAEVLDTYAKSGREFQNACCIYPTAPFLRAKVLAAGKSALLGGPFDVIMPVVPFTFPIWRSVRREESGRVVLNFPQYLNARSQDLSPAYHDAGQWYWFRVAAFLKEKTLIGDNSGSLQILPTEAQDIDTEEDWELAEMKHQRMFG